MGDIAIARLIGSLLLIVLLILIVAWCLQRSGMLKTIEGPQIRILGARHIGARQQVVVVDVEGTRLLLGVSARQLSLLHVLTAPAHATDSAQARHDFSGTLSSALEQR